VKKLTSLLIALFSLVWLTGAGWLPLAKSGGAVSFSIANTDYVEDATSQTTYTFTGRAIGSAAASRVVVVVVASRVSGAASAASGVTIGGSSASLVKSLATTVTNTDTIDVYQLAIAAGTTATVVVTYPAAMARCGVAVYSVIGSNGVVPSGAAAATSASLTAPSASITVPVGGGSIVGASGGGGPNTATATNYTQDLANNIGASGTIIVAGHDTSHSGSTTYTITWDAAAAESAAAFAAWSP